MMNKEKIMKGLFYCSGMGKCIDCSYKSQGFLSQYIKTLEDKLRLLEYGDQNTFEDTLMPAT